MNRLAIALALTPAVLGCKRKVNAGEIEALVKQRTDELGMNASKVTCPSDIAPKVGATFECTVDVEGKSYALDGTVTSVDGSAMKFDTEWKGGKAGVVIRSKLVPPLTAELTKQFSTPVTVACPEPLLFRDASGNVACDMTAGATKAKVLVTLDDKLVPTSWKVAPPLLAKAKMEELLTASVREKLGPAVAVTCGSEPLLARPASGIVVCAIADGDKKGEINVEVDPDLNIKRWDVANGD